MINPRKPLDPTIPCNFCGFPYPSTFYAAMVRIAHVSKVNDNNHCISRHFPICSDNGTASCSHVQHQQGYYEFHTKGSTTKTSTSDWYNPFMRQCCLSRRLTLATILSPKTLKTVTFPIKTLAIVVAVVWTLSWH